MTSHVLVRWHWVVVRLFLLVLPSAVCAFTNVYSPNHLNPNHPCRRRTTFVPRPMVVVYTPEGNWVEEETPYEDILASMTDEQVHMCEELSDADHIGALARLAAAFAPPGHALHLLNIQSVSVVGIDETHLDIQTVICGESGCVTVKVPVRFPEPCDDLHDEECIFHQFEELDHQADDVLLQRKREEDEQLQNELDMTEERAQLLRDLYAPDGICFPPWWTFSVDLADECKNIQRLLNGPDFQPEVQALVYTALPDDYLGWVVDKAVVSQVGPAGLFMRAIMVNYSINVDDTSSQLVDAPLAFGMVADSVADLRAVVLGAVASTTDENYLEEPTRTTTTTTTSSTMVQQAQDNIEYPSTMDVTLLDQEETTETFTAVDVALDQSPATTTPMEDEGVRLEVIQDHQPQHTMTSTASSEKLAVLMEEYLVDDMGRLTKL